MVNLQDMDNHASLWTSDCNLFLVTEMFPDEPQLFNALRLLIYFSQPEPSQRTSIKRPQFEMHPLLSFVQKHMFFML